MLSINVKMSQSCQIRLACEDDNFKCVCKYIQYYYTILAIVGVPLVVFVMLFLDVSNVIRELSGDKSTSLSL